MLLPPRYQIVDAVDGGNTLVVVEHQLPEMEIQQQVTDVDQIRWIPQQQLRQSSSDRFMDFVRVNIGLIINDSQFQNQQLQQWWGDFPPLVEHFEELVQQIQGFGQNQMAPKWRMDEHRQDGRFMCRADKTDGSGSRISSVKILFG